MGRNDPSGTHGPTRPRTAAPPALDRVAASRVRAERASLLEAVAHLAAGSIAASTRRAVEADWVEFAEFCGDHGRTLLPADPETVCMYYAWLSRKHLSRSTIRRRQFSVAYVHRLNDLPSPTADLQARAVMSGLMRSDHLQKVRSREAVGKEDLRRMLAQVETEDLRGLRDRALLLVGFFTGRPRAQLVAIQIEDLRLAPEGLRVEIRRAQRNQEGGADPIGLPYREDEATCPVRALQAYVQAAGISSGAVFRAILPNGRVGPDPLSDRSVALIVKRYAKRAGIDAQLAGHALRAGLAVAAYSDGAPSRVIMKQLGVRSPIALLPYRDTAELFKENVGHYVKL